MNIFALSENPERCALYHCDKHVVKMLLEYCQMMSASHHLFPRTDIQLDKLYKKGWINHPCTKWVYENTANYAWLYQLTLNLSAVYTYRYNKIHKCTSLFDTLSYFPNIKFSETRSPFVMAMPNIYKCSDPILSYRKYYIAEKSKFAKWKSTPPPYWWITKETTEDLC